MHPIQGIHHIAVSVPDIQTARRFYMELVSHAEWPRGTAFVNAIVTLRAPDQDFGNVFELMEVNAASANAAL